MRKHSGRPGAGVLARAIALVLALALLSGCGGSGGGGGAGPSALGPGPTPAIAPGPSSPVASAGTTAPGDMREETFQGCPPQGDGGDTDLNLRKNRIDVAPAQSTPLQSLLSLTWPRGVEKARRSAWTADDAATVARDEGRPVMAEGYVLLVRHEGPESPNCHDATARDYHTWLAAAPGGLGDRAASMVVEFTPRVVARNSGWTETTLLALRGHHVRVGGWLMLDQEHPEQVGKTRGTLWEIHPITSVQVDQGGTWRDLSEVSGALGSAPVNRQPASDGQAGPDAATPAPSHHRARHPRHHRSSSYWRYRLAEASKASSGGPMKSPDGKTESS